MAVTLAPLLLLLLLALALAAQASAALEQAPVDSSGADVETTMDHDTDNDTAEHLPISVPATASGGPWRRAMQGFGYCGRNPSVCRYSPRGPTCCKKFCTNLKTDKYNCGRCGRVLNKRLSCCYGKAVNLKNDSKNCGRCGNKCQKNETCFLGLCNYNGPSA